MLNVLLFIFLALLALVEIARALKWPILEFFKQNLGELVPDVRMLFSRSKFDQAVNVWKQRVKVYAQLKSTNAASLGSGAKAEPAATEPAAARADTVLPAEDSVATEKLQATRIDYLSSDRLRIIDTKFSALLQTQTLLGVMMTITINRFWNELYDIIHSGPWGGVRVIVPFTLWFMTIVGCLLAVGNIRWGNLEKNPSDLRTTEEEYVKTLIEVVIVRTAMLRLLTAIALVNFILISSAVAYLAYTSPRNP
jgi:hypothetical protein